MKLKITALALIGILLFSSSFSAVDAYTITFKINEINGNPVLTNVQSTKYSVLMIDGIKTTYSKYVEGFEPKIHQINLVDGILSSFSTGNENSDVLLEGPEDSEMGPLDENIPSGLHQIKANQGARVYRCPSVQF